jgi:tetratricopeptide (TPR) repeat protein
VQALERRGFAYRSAKQFDEAAEDFTKLIKKSPKDVEAYRRRGVAYTEGGKFKEAVEDFEQVLKLKPNDEDAKTRLKYAESKAKDPAAPVASPPAGATP